jgi:hypothetical protein
MVGAEMLLAQVNEAAGELDEALVKQLVPVLALEPEMFEHVVRLVVFATIETNEVPGVAGMQAAGLAGVQRADERFHAIELFHPDTV